ncbi:MAG: hypothetical protein QOF82_3407 [Frankiales bacterium]|nr:hypothetical protein [Frankiales bacterium]
MVNVVAAPGSSSPFSSPFLAVTLLPFWLPVALVHDVIFCLSLAKLQVTVQPVLSVVPVFLTVMVAWSRSGAPVAA